MLRVTFLGHQGWALSAKETTLLIDPLFHEGIGDGQDYYLKLYPPRQLELTKLPAITAVVITHEHPDHFHLPSLALLDRSIPIYLSALSSTAARRVLRDLGFTVHLLSPTDRLTLGALTLIALHPDGRTRADEWDVIPFVVHTDEHQGRDNFFSTIDLSPTQNILRELKTLVPQVGVWSIANNDLDLSPFYTWYPFNADQSAARAASWKEQYHQFFHPWVPPALISIYGGGFEFDGDLSWLNRTVFNCDSFQAAEHLRKALPSVPIHAPIPGETVLLQGGKRIETHTRAPYLATVAKEQWPLHTATPSTDGQHARFFPPGTGTADLLPEQTTELVEHLQQLARFLYNSSLFHLLYKIGPKDCPGRHPTIAFLLRTSSRPTYSVWAYDPQACAFIEDPHAAVLPDPTTAYCAGVECWATDLLALFRFERTAGYTLFGRMRFWNTLPQQYNVDLDMVLYLYAHPLCQPDRYYTVYRRQADTVMNIEPIVHGHLHAQNAKE